MRVVVIISKRAFDSPALTYERKIVSCIKSVRYTSLQIDGKLRYVEHALISAEKAIFTAGALFLI